MATPLEDAEHGAWQALPVGPLGPPPHASESSFLKSGVYDGATCSWNGRGWLNECLCVKDPGIMPVDWILPS